MVNTYYEVRVDGDRTAAFGWEAPHQRLDAFRKAQELINEIQFSFQKTKVLQIVDFKIEQKIGWNAAQKKISSKDHQKRSRVRLKKIIFTSKKIFPRIHFSYTEGF